MSPATEQKTTVRLLTAEEYAAERRVPLSVVKRMLRPNDPKTVDKFDPRDIERHGLKCVRIRSTEPSVTGFRLPRLVKRKAVKA